MKFSDFIHEHFTLLVEPEKSERQQTVSGLSGCIALDRIEDPGHKNPDPRAANLVKEPAAYHLSERLNPACQFRQGRQSFPEDLPPKFRILRTLSPESIHEWAQSLLPLDDAARTPARNYKTLLRFPRFLSDAGCLE